MRHTFTFSPLFLPQLNTLRNMRDHILSERYQRSHFVEICQTTWDMRDCS